jgi:hypothetical protein
MNHYCWATNCPSRIILCVELAVDSRLWPSSGQATNLQSSARIPRSSPTGELTAAATVPTCRWRPSPLRLPSPWEVQLQWATPSRCTANQFPNRRASNSRWPTHLVTVGGRDLAGAATPLGGARLPCSSVEAQPSWFGPGQWRPSVNSIPCDFLIDLV